MTTKSKHIKIDRPIPIRWKQAIEEKREWIRKVQSGEIEIVPTKIKKFV